MPRRHRALAAQIAACLAAGLAGCGDPAGPGRVPAGVIAYTAFRRNPLSPQVTTAVEIHAVRSDGRDVRTLVALPSPTTAALSAWAPDGSAVAFLAFAGTSRRYNLMVAARDGGEARVVLADAVQGENPPTWSPDGRRLAFICTDGAGQRQVCSVGVGGDAWRQLTALPPACPPLAVAWAPDGGRVAYACLGAGDAAGVYAVSADGSGSGGRLTADVHDVTALAWSPDGAELAVVGTRTSGAPDVLELLVLRADGGGLTPLAGAAPAGPRAGVSWSPDGRWLAFGGGQLGRDPQSPARVYAVSRAGGGLRAVTPDSVEAVYPTWAARP